MMNHESQSQFIESWGAMGMLWGVNRSTARIHALLISSAEPLTLDQISERLEISRGNASMCLKELRNWGVVHKVPLSGDRRDFYVTEPDVWHMFFRIMKERKRREFDPALDAVRQALAQGEAEAGEESPVFRRLVQMEDLFSTMERAAAKLLADERASKAMLGFMTGSFLGKE